MCGIAGVVAPSAALLRPLPAMLAALRHRGPDDEGYVIVESGSRRARAHRGRDTVDGLRYPPFPAELPAGADLGLGHRRLAILDLSSAGHGPMPSADGHRWITYNGEIYNYLELREELKGLGHSFASATDTEVILAAWQEWGPECLPRFNGMWAFALYDGKRNVLFCARDRFGVKPLHYHAAGGLFAFAQQAVSKTHQASGSGSGGGQTCTGLPQTAVLAILSNVSGPPFRVGPAVVNAFITDPGS